MKPKKPQQSGSDADVAADALATKTLDRPQVLLMLLMLMTLMTLMLMLMLMLGRRNTFNPACEKADPLDEHALMRHPPPDERRIAP